MVDNPREIGALIFDMDGVIIDSNPLHRAAWIEYNRRHGIDTTEAMLRRMYGRHTPEIIRDFFADRLSEAEVLAHGAAKEALYRDLMRPQIQNSLVPGVREFLERHRNLPLGVATNGEPANLAFVLDEAGLRHFFREMVTGFEVRNPKPDPEIYLRIADLLGVGPAKCVVFEDSHAGVAAGLAAGMRVVGIGTTDEDLSGVSLMVRDFTDPALESWLANANYALWPPPKPATSP